ncbi:MAG: diguanylate cyclase [Deltaproteobacteria bacterium]|nr:diguanylate cyclase [Deltaproteobacteria bacterium]
MDNDLYKTLLDNIYDGVYCVDRQRVITYWNKAAERITGYSASEVIGKGCFDNILIHLNDEGVNLCLEGCPLVQAMEDGHPRSAEVYLHHKEGHRLPVVIRVAPIQDAKGRIAGAVEVFSDNSAKVSLAQRLQDLQSMAFHDSLTNVANRRFIEQTVASRIDEYQRYGWPVGILFIDVDNFKAINDTDGHDTGDRVLQMVAKTIQGNLRPFDILGRWGGEEFVAVIVNVNQEKLHSLAERVRSLVEHSSLHSGSRAVGVTVSIGATLANADDSMATLVKRADRLMYQSKAAGKNRVSL